MRPEGIDMFHFNHQLELSFKQSFSMTEQVVLSVVIFLSVLIVGILAKFDLSDIVIASPILMSFLSASIYFIFRMRQVKYIKVDANEVRIMKHPNVFKTNSSI